MYHRRNSASRWLPTRIDASWLQLAWKTDFILSYIGPPVLLFTLHFNPLNTKLNPICHLLALLEAHHILHVSRIRVKLYLNKHVSHHNI